MLPEPDELIKYIKYILLAQAQIIVSLSNTHMI